ncbi:TorD/DmsD family molecular chaperone [Vibrio coralliilyticus]|uniref:TorD/DmsD family molecular chaperone n=1 Tax=Vibrio coralliilyticus TaxID=190893 RepID=UPI00148CD9D1|nr:molecular chaperone TorD family protein [Vibrio coralliilyticus]NOI29459.1 molecular chaperone [Vibrio coralliilyticus]NOI48277.1 molecular chaperone [Vibrio coralliilyticus]
MKVEEQLTLRADIYLMLSALYRQCPTVDLVQFLADLEIENAPSEMQSAWQALKQAALDVNASALEDEYHELFIGIGRGEAVPFASWHRTGSLMEKPLANIRHDLKLLGLEREENIKEPEDHISALCEVMAVLVREQDPQQQRFFNTHISPWFTSFVRQVKQAQHARFYLSVAQLCEAFLILEQVRFSEKVKGAKANSRIDVKNAAEYEQTQR